ncbi:hypothetical protein RB195_001617 [Necator americanus]|uniref:Uncharacterized protein n=1 Tax=Necator americanus TaxID=51031 RepID=A0ABR1DF58_NECAM
MDQLRAQLDTAQGPLQRHSSLENILDDNGEGTERVEEMLGLARPAKTGHLNSETGLKVIDGQIWSTVSSHKTVLRNSTT